MVYIFTVEFSKANSESHKRPGCHVRSTGKGIHQFPQQPGPSALGQCSLPISQILGLMGQRSRTEDPVCECEPTGWKGSDEDHTHFAYALLMLCGDRLM